MPETFTFILVEVSRSEIKFTSKKIVNLYLKQINLKNLKISQIYLNIF